MNLLVAYGADNRQVEEDEKQMDALRLDLKEGMDFVYEMKAIAQENHRRMSAEYSVLQSKKQDLEKMLSDLIAKEDSARGFFVPSEYNENKKEQYLMTEEIQQIEAQRQKKYEDLEQIKLRNDKIERLAHCMECFELILEEKFESDPMQEDAEAENTDQDLEEEAKNKTGEENIEENKEIEKSAEEEKEDTFFGRSKIQKESIKESILEMQEMEQGRIFRELHDSAIQNLIAINHKAELIENVWNMDGNRAKIELTALKKMVTESIEEMRNIVYHLSPIKFINSGLKGALIKLVDQLNKNNKISIYLAAEDDPGSNSAVDLALYRIAQEACRNSICYSGASQIHIELKYIENQAQLVIEDNGSGFDVKECQKRAMEEGRGFGLFVMKERVFLLSGKFNISTSSGTGTKITVSVPYLQKSA